MTAPGPDVQITDDPVVTLTARGVPTVWAVFSSPEAREAWLGAHKAEHGFDYVLDWRDTQGYGLEASFTVVTVARRLVAFLSGTAR